MDGELRSENLYLPPMPEQRSVVAAVMIALYLQIETVLEGVVVGKLRFTMNEDMHDRQGGTKTAVELETLNLITLHGVL